MTFGQKLIESLKEAQAGNFARVTIEGQTWVRVEEVREAIAAAYEDAARMADEGYEEVYQMLRDEGCCLCEKDCELMLAWIAAAIRKRAKE